MTDTATDNGAQDLFDDSESDTSPADKDTSSEITTQEPQDETTDDSGEDETGTPPVEQEGDPEFTTDAKGQKMIPEHRFKAALKAVTEERDNLKAANARYTAEPIPDRNTDPQGYDLHTRMEASKAVMREMRDDYQVVINHYAEMAESNPLLNQAVAGHPLPAKLAYDIAKKDLEIKEALAVKGSDEWKEFQEFKKTKTTAASAESKLGKAVAQGLRTVPNLNRLTSASPNKNSRRDSSDDDELFKGAL